MSNADRQESSPKGSSVRWIALSLALALVGRKGTPEDVEQLRAFLWSVAEHVANARKEGFLGLTGERVSEAEEEALGRIKGALGMV